MMFMHRPRFGIEKKHLQDEGISKEQTVIDPVEGSKSGNSLWHHLIDKKQTFEKFPVAVTTGVVVLK